ADDEDSPPVDARPFRGVARRTRRAASQPEPETKTTPQTMNPITKPMLAGKCERPDALSFPVLATPKLDGIRCLKINGRALTRSFKPVSNRYTRGWIEANLPDGLDGELIVRGTTCSETAGHIGRESGEPSFTFAVFDYVSDGVDVPYACRMQELAR